MDKETLDKLVRFDIELGRWRWLLRHYMLENSNLPDFIVASMSIEDMVEYVLKDRDKDGKVS